ncbi:MAG: hypothetical protein ACR2FG_00275 [Marmoricola sp.]
MKTVDELELATLAWVHTGSAIAASLNHVGPRLKRLRARGFDGSADQGSAGHSAHHQVLDLSLGQVSATVPEQLGNAVAQGAGQVSQDKGLLPQ